MNVVEASERIRREGLIAILRGAFSRDQLLGIAEALLEGGVTVLELTLNSADALGGIPLLRERLGARALVGAGTVRTVAEVDAAVGAGAQFLVAPNFDPASAARARQHGVLHLPGVLTPSEAQAAFAAGCEMVKLFPADALGPSYLKAIRAPLDRGAFIPTGGVHPENVGAYVHAGAVALGVGSALVRDPEEPPEALRARAARFVAALREARGDPPHG